MIICSFLQEPAKEKAHWEKVRRCNNCCILYYLELLIENNGL